MSILIRIFLLSLWLCLISGNQETCLWEQVNNFTCSTFLCPFNKCGDFDQLYNNSKCLCEIQTIPAITGCQLINTNGTDGKPKVRSCDEYHPFICSDNYNNFQIYADENMTWTDAVEKCASRNLHIATVNLSACNYPSDDLFWTGMFYGLASENDTDVSQFQIISNISIMKSNSSIYVRCKMHPEEFRTPTSSVCPALSTPSTAEPGTTSEPAITPTLSSNENPNTTSSTGGTTSDSSNINNTVSTITNYSTTEGTSSTMTTKTPSTTDGTSPTTVTQTAEISTASSSNESPQTTMPSSPTYSSTSSTTTDDVYPTASNTTLVNVITSRVTQSVSETNGISTLKNTTVETKPVGSKDNEQNHKDNTAVIAGAVSGAVVLLIIGATVVYVKYRRNRGREKNIKQTSGIAVYTDRSLRGKPRRHDEYQNPIYLPQIQNVTGQHEGDTATESDDESKYDHFENKNDGKDFESEDDTYDHAPRLDIQDDSSHGYSVMNKEKQPMGSDVYDHVGALNDGTYGQLHQKDEPSRPDSDTYNALHELTQDELL